MNCHNETMTSTSCHLIIYSIPSLVIISSIKSFFYPLSFKNYFDINDNYNPYCQQYPPLALMETSKHSPPLTMTTKDNLLCSYCNHLDREFLIFLIFDNYPCQYISSFKKFSSLLLFLLLTGLGTNHCVMI